MDNKEQEFLFIKEYTRNFKKITWYQYLLEEVEFRRLHCLWTAFCLRYDLKPLTPEYENKLKILFDIMEERNPGVFNFDDIPNDEFNWAEIMAGYL